MTLRPDIHPFGPLRLEPARTATLSNGIPVTYIPDPQCPVLTLALNTTGGENEAAVPRMPDLLGQSLRRGTASHSAEYIAERIDHSGSALNIAGASHHVGATLVLNAQYFDEIAELLRSMLQSPTIPEPTFEIDKAMFVAERRQQLERTRERAFDACVAHFYGPAHPQGRIPTELQLQGITRDALLDFHRRHFVADGASIVLSGNITDSHLARLDDIFGHDWGGPNSGLILKAPEPTGLGEVVEVPMPGKRQSSIVMRAAAPLRSHDDFIPLRIAVTLLGGFMGSRLMQNVREKKGLTYGINAYLLGLRDESTVTIVTDCNLERAATVLQEIRHEMEALGSTLASTDELKRLRQHMSSALLKLIDTSIARAALIAKGARDGFGEEYIKRHLEILSGITSEEIRDVAARYLRPDRFVTAMTTA